MIALDGPDSRSSFRASSSWQTRRPNCCTQAPATRGDPDGPLAPAARIGFFVVGCLAVSGGGGTLGQFSDTAPAEGNSTSAGTSEIESDVRLTPDTLAIDDNGTVTAPLETPTGNGDVDPATVEVRLEGTAVEAPLTNCNPTKCPFEPEARAFVESVDGGAGEYELRVAGELEDGTPFEATTSITVGDSVGADDA